jgi:hypothetical protein
VAFVVELEDRRTVLIALLGDVSEDQTSGRRFTRLVGSFRPARSITAVGFAYDQKTQETDRLVTGDDEGNVHVWQFDRENDRWTDTQGAGAQLVGQHVEPIVAVQFDPQDKNLLLTADQTGKWVLSTFDGNQWSFDGDQWTDMPADTPPLGGQQENCVALSPDGSKIFLGRDDHAWIYDTDNLENAFDDWATGSIRTATYADDGSWIATSETIETDETIHFWNRNGTKRDKAFSSEDTKGLTTMDWSWDRRRLITGNRDGEVIVWDTRALVDPGNDQSDIKPLLTLEDHEQNDVVAVAVSPNRRGLLSADKTGRTILRSGAKITPIALTRSRSQVSLRVGGPAKKIDPEIILSDPSRLADFSQAKISMKDGAEQDPFPAGRLSNLEEIRASLNAEATAATVQALLRSSQYEIPETVESKLHAESSNDAVAATDEPTRVNRTLTIEILGIQYGDAGEGLGHSGEDGSVSKSLSVEFTLEIDSTSDDSAEPSSEQLTEDKKIRGTKMKDG